MKDEYKFWGGLFLLIIIGTVGYIIYGWPGAILAAASALLLAARKKIKEGGDHA